MYNHLEVGLSYTRFVIGRSLLSLIEGFPEIYIEILHFYLRKEVWMEVVKETCHASFNLYRYAPNEGKVDAKCTSQVTTGVRKRKGEKEDEKVFTYRISEFDLRKCSSG